MKAKSFDDKLRTIVELIYIRSVNDAENDISYLKGKTTDDGTKDVLKLFLDTIEKAKHPYIKHGNGENVDERVTDDELAELGDNEKIYLAAWRDAVSYFESNLKKEINHE